MNHLLHTRPGSDRAAGDGCGRVAGFTVFALGIALVVPAASGQHVPGASYNRPSANSASAGVNRVGGNYTGDANPTLFTLKSQRSGVNVLGGGSGGVRSRYPSPGSTGSMLMQGSSLSMPMSLPGSTTIFRNRSIDTGEVSSWDLIVSSGFNGATQFTAPIHGWRTAPPRVNSPLYPSVSERTDFQRFFGLNPPSKPEQNQPGATVVGIIEENNEDAARSTMQRAALAFKSKDYSQAMMLLSVVKRADKTDAMPCLLIAHAALEQDQMWLAVTSLLDAIRRNPDLFVEGADVRSYYADADRFEKLMRSYSRSTVDKDSWAAQVLRCYCAWQLGDKISARASLDTLNSTEMRQNAQSSLVVRNFVYAMTPALK